MSLSRASKAGGWAATLVGVAAGLCVLATARASNLIDVRFGVTSQTETRVVFDLSGSVDYALSGDGEGQGRLIVTMDGVPLAAPRDGKGKGHVALYRSTAVGGAAQIVLAFGRTAKVKDAFLIPAKAAGENTRLVIDLISADKETFLASLPRKYDDIADVIQAATDPIEAKLGPPLPEEDWPVVVIDAGHGGADPGTTGPGGVAEKTVTLAAAIQLADILREKGRYRIVLTRASDTRIGLEDRLKAAREAQADLFVSLHADAHKDASVRGASVYTLSEEGSQRSAREALSQGDFQVYGNELADAQPDVQRIVLDVTQNYTNGRSARFADLLLKDLAATTRLVNNSHRTADLKVLLSPDVAAALIELGFISNKQDEAELASPVWRDKTMRSVAAAIDQYFDARFPIRQAANGAEGGH